MNKAWIGINRKFFSIWFLVFCVMINCMGCSHTLYKRDRNKNKPDDVGSETKIQLRGPRAVLQHKF